MKNAIRTKTVGTRSNRDSIGAVVKVNGSSWQMVRSGPAYCSQSAMTLTFGMGKAAQADSVEITRPAGQRGTLGNLAANHTYSIEEGGKILATRPFKR